MAIAQGLTTGLSAVIITNSKISAIKSLNRLLEVTEHIVIVTNSKEDLAHNGNLKIIYSKSQNYAYLRNLGAYYANTTHIFVIDSDELMDDTLINSLENLDFKFRLYCVKVNMYIGSYKMMMTTKYGQRLYDKRYFFYIGRVHEGLFGSVKDCVKINGDISNFSQEDWQEWHRKAKRYTAQESIRWDLITRATYSLYVFFKHQGWRDGLLGVKWTIRSLQYIAMTLIYGRKGYMTLNPQDIKSRLSASEISQDEKNYISSVMKQYFDEDKSIPLQDMDSVTLDILEQISSPFISYS